MDKDLLVKLTADLVSSYVGNNSLSDADIDRASERLPLLIGKVHAALSDLLKSEAVIVDTAAMRSESPFEAAPANSPEAPPSAGAVKVEDTIHPDYMVCLEDGEHYKTLKRHLRISHGLTPEQYRAKWGLPQSYPMVCPDYAAARSDVAKNTGLGLRKSVEPPVSSNAGRRARKARVKA